MIDLYYWPTPNGYKITIFLEETGTDYRIIPVHENLDDFPDLKRWFETIRARRAVVRAYERGAAINSQPVVDEDAKKLLFGQTADTIRASAT